MNLRLMADSERAALLAAWSMDVKAARQELRGYRREVGARGDLRIVFADGESRITQLSREARKASWPGSRAPVGSASPRLRRDDSPDLTGCRRERLTADGTRDVRRRVNPNGSCELPSVRLYPGQSTCPSAPARGWMPTSSFFAVVPLGSEVHL